IGHNQTDAPEDEGLLRKAARFADFGVFSSHFRYLSASLWLVAAPARLHARARTVSSQNLGEPAMHHLSRRTALRLGLLVALPFAVPRQSRAMDVPLAIQGYDPVAYFTDGKPTRGTPN